MEEHLQRGVHSSAAGQVCQNEKGFFESFALFVITLQEITAKKQNFCL
ncbi:hypothetical protein [Morganella morganii]|nr:hypothetical protein [Morganella morganii]ELT0454699.1 hypothetical protein [Morganella morganii]QQO73917.1 hypothetical protein IDH72_07380 [Morganella morganii]